MRLGGWLGLWACVAACDSGSFDPTAQLVSLDEEDRVQICDDFVAVVEEHSCPTTSTFVILPDAELCQAVARASLDSATTFEACGQAIAQAPCELEPSCDYGFDQWFVDINHACPMELFRSPPDPFPTKRVFVGAEWTSEEDAGTLPDVSNNGYTTWEYNTYAMLDGPWIGLSYASVSDNSFSGGGSSGPMNRWWDGGFTTSDSNYCYECELTGDMLTCDGLLPVHGDPIQPPQMTGTFTFIEDPALAAELSATSD